LKPFISGYLYYIILGNGVFDLLCEAVSLPQGSSSELTQTKAYFAVRLASQGRYNFSIQ
jgi:hypothetical protein